MKTVYYYYVLAGMLLFYSCSVNDQKYIGSIEKLDPLLDSVVESDAKIEILSDGHQWAEGPVWVGSQNMLLFSDVPKNTIFRWTEADGLSTYLSPSGFTGAGKSESREPGSNGLAITVDDQLMLCQHGDRRVAIMNATLSAPEPKFSTLADRYEGKRFNSPNDLCVHINGDIYFTDPPYGLPQQEKDTSREISFQGVYRIRDGKISLITDSLTRPNGVALNPDGTTLYVSNSDPAKAVWYSFSINGDSISGGTIFHDATALTKSEKGLPDGLKVNRQGTLFASGPGGIWIFSASGKVLGKIRLPVASANCALSTDEKTLFVTAHQYLLRIKLRS